MERRRSAHRCGPTTIAPLVLTIVGTLAQIGATAAPASATPGLVVADLNHDHDDDGHDHDDHDDDDHDDDRRSMTAA